jgi:restriction endonuclease
MFDPAGLATLITQVDGAPNANDKGSSFELLAKYLFENLDGVEVHQHDIQMAAEEIDIVLWNSQREDVLRPWDPVILVECKNWTSRVDAKALDSFIAKVRRRALKTAIFVAANGVTGGFVAGDGKELGAASIIASALQEGIRVIVITMDDIRGLASLDDLRSLIKSRYCGLFVHKVL